MSVRSELQNLLSELERGKHMSDNDSTGVRIEVQLLKTLQRFANVVADMDTRIQNLESKLSRR